MVLLNIKKKKTWIIPTTHEVTPNSPLLHPRVFAAARVAPHAAALTPRRPWRQVSWGFAFFCFFCVFCREDVWCFIYVFGVFLFVFLVF